MPRQRANVDSDRVMSNDDTSIDLQRAANKAYMRRWRSDEVNRLRERARRAASYCERKSRAARKSQKNSPSDPIGQICAICKKRPSIGQVFRLRLRISSPSGFEEVLIPYCGKC